MKPNRTDYIVALANPKKKDSVLTVGVANIPEIEQKLENDVSRSVCIDFDRKKIDGAKKYVKKTKFLYGDITKFKTKNRFDTIIMLEVLEHIDDDKKALENIRNMLKKGGKLIISVPNKNMWHVINPVKYTQHKRHYSLHDIISLLRQTGFSIKSTNTVESPKLLFDLYVHLFCKYILRKNVHFGILTGKEDKTYRKHNSESAGLDSLVVAVKN